MSQDDLEEILRTSRENNARLGITGMLLYGNNTFVQILEGEDKAVSKAPRPKGGASTFALVKNFDWPNKNGYGLPKTVCMTEKLAESLGSSALLFREIPRE